MKKKFYQNLENGPYLKILEAEESFIKLECAIMSQLGNNNLF